MTRTAVWCARVLRDACLPTVAAGMMLLPTGASAQTLEPTVMARAVAAAEKAAAERAAKSGPKAPFGARAASMRDSLVALARQQLGRRYVLGGADPSKGFDCSGLIRYIASALRIDVPRTAALQERVGEELPKDTSRLRPGDLITFGRGKRATHIGIYVGEGRFIHASSAAGRVIESPLDRPPAKRIKPWRGARRIVVAEDSAGRGVGG